MYVIEQSTENAFSHDNSWKPGQLGGQNGGRIQQRFVTNEIGLTVNQLSKQIKDLDKKNTRTEKLISSIKDIKNVVMTIETNHQTV